MAKFEKITKYQDVDFELPQRKTKTSAGYDFVAVEDIVVPSYFKQVATMILGVLGDSDLQAEVEKTEYGQRVKDIQGITQEELQSLIQNNIPEVMILLKDFFKMDLSEMKAFTKKTNTKLTLVPTGVKAYMDDNQVLELAIRSSIPMSNFLTLANGIGIIDADYVDNIDNEGHIFFQVINMSPFDITIKKGDIIGQGMFKRYEMTEDDVAGGIRNGGCGSTSK